ncbi:hypothetical protein ACK8P5_17710 [Paenibacillus sp. EC2-1]|uniref:hypothetical protein n=1 Tax=Paenibacillus sp. EC2-1 TaxID=3388665 RepID=UPI003BEF4053
MRLQRFYQSKEDLIEKFMLVDSSAKSSLILIDEVLEVNIKTATNDELIIEFTDFNTKYMSSSDDFLMSESFFIVIRKIATVRAGEKFIDPLLEYLNEVLALMILIPTKSFNEMHRTQVEIISREYYPQGSIEYDDVEYQAFQSAQAMC